MKGENVKYKHKFIGSVKEDGKTVCHRVESEYLCLPMPLSLVLRNGG